MIYSILRLMPNGEIDTHIVKGENLDNELQCWTLESVFCHSNLLLFIMSDDESSGHDGKNRYNFQNKIFQDDDMLAMIKESHRTLDMNKVYKEMFFVFGVPQVLIPYILHECKNSMGLI